MTSQLLIKAIEGTRVKHVSQAKFASSHDLAVGVVPLLLDMLMPISKRKGLRYYRDIILML